MNRNDATTQRTRRKSKAELDELGKKLYEASFRVHREMGPGLLEKVYERCLLKELNLMGVKAFDQVHIPLYYKGHDLEKEHVIDLLIEGEILVELKSVDALHPVHEAQLISYLKLSEKRLGYLINFNVPLIKEGIRRKVNGL